MIDTISSNLEYSMMPTVDMLETLTENPEFKDFEFLKLCYEKCKLGEAFPKAWRASVTEKASDNSLNRNDTDLLISLGEILGSVDAAGQISRLGACRETVKNELAKAEQTFEKYGKNMPAMGALCSITLGIVLL